MKLCEQILLQNTSHAFERFLKQVVENNQFPVNEDLLLNIVKLIKQHHPSLIPSLLVSSLFKLFLKKNTVESTTRYFKEINLLLDDEFKISTTQALLNSPRIISPPDLIDTNNYNRLLLSFFGQLTYIQKENQRTFLTYLFHKIPLDLLKNFKSFKIIDEELRFEIALKASKDFPILLCTELTNFEIQIPSYLRQLGYSIYRRDQFLGLSYAKKFHISSKEEFDTQEILELTELSGESLEAALQTKYYEIRQPELLELMGHVLLKKYTDLTQDYEIHWAARFLEKAATIYQQKGIVDKAQTIRKDLAVQPLICQTNPLNDLDNLGCKPFILQGPQGPLNFGAPFQFMGSHTLKGGYFHIRDIIVDDQPYREIYFKLAYWAAQQVHENLNILEKNQNPFSLQISLSHEPFFYYANEGGRFVTDRSKAIEAGKALTVNLKGLAKIQIGESKDWGSMLNSVRIWLAPNASSKDIQKTLAIMGLAEILTQATPGDVERIITNTLIRFIAPDFAATHDNKADYHAQPLSKLHEKLPSDKTRLKVKKSVKNIKTYTICGDKRFSLRFLSDKAELWQGIGFYTQCKGDVKEIASRIGSLFRIGFISSQKRFEMGLTHIKGDSPEKDLQLNSADGIFFRLLSESSLSRYISRSNVKGNIQIYAKLKAIQLLPYFYYNDHYGTRLRDHTYKNRPDFKSFFTQLQGHIHDKDNEIIFKNRLPPKYLCAITYQDPRKDIVKAIEHLGKVQLFKQGSSLKENVDRVSSLYFSTNPEDKKQVLDALKCPLFDTVDETYQISPQSHAYSLATHWMLDPKPAIEASLKASGINPDPIPIIETDIFTPEVFQACHQPLHIKVRKVALKPHLSTQPQYNIRDDYPTLIDAIRARLQTFSKQRLQAYITEAIVKQIRQLRDFCQKYLGDIFYNGQDSLNRELLTQPEDLGLQNSSLIAGLYALEEMQRRESEAHDKNPLQEALIFIAKKGCGETVARKITDCLYYGLKDNPAVILERLPNNQSLGKVLTLNPKHGKMKYLREYVRRTKINETFVPILKAFEKAYEKILEHKPPAIALRNSLFNQAYDPEKWQDEYPALFIKILAKIDSLEETPLLHLIASHHTPHKLKEQVKEGFSLLMQYENKLSQDMTLEDIVKYITDCDGLLDQKISHLFYDRLHLLATLKADESYFITTKTGPLSLKNLMIALVTSFKQGVKASNAIAAEQFYLRLLQIHEKIWDLRD